MSKIIKTFIVEENEIMSYEDILKIEINELYIENVMKSCAKRNEFLAKCKIIENKKHCNFCPSNPLQSYIKDGSRIDGFRWSCRLCGKTVSIRHNSFFYNCKLDFVHLFKMFYKYLKGEEFSEIAYELNIHRNTASIWSDFLREAIAYYVEMNSVLLGGVDEEGRSKIAEIDESLFFRRKYNRGRLLDNQWFVGGIERGTRNVFIIPVENRNTETMVRIISEYCLPGTTIVTDQWRAYSSAIQTLGNMQHETINHSLYFVDPERHDIHTQNIEGLWSRSKFFMRKRRGITREKKAEYLIQFIFEYMTEKRKRFNVLLFLLRY